MRRRSIPETAAGLLGLIFALDAHAYSASADVTFAWAEAGIIKGWTSNGVNAFPDPAAGGNDTLVSLLAGNNSTTYVNADFAQASDYAPGTGDDCLTPLPDYETIALRKYGCRHNDLDLYYASDFNAVPATDIGPGAVAVGTLSVTDTTLTGTLTVISSTDEPTGATTTFVSGLRTSDSPGDGLDGYNVRIADGSPFGHAWYGISTDATLAVNLTGTFTETDWTIDGGAVTFNDPGFACQQGGFGGDPNRGILCSASGTGGGFQNNGGHLSWGMDLDGANFAYTQASPIEVRNASGTSIVTLLSGVLAYLTVDGEGNLSTIAAEVRSAAGNTGTGCPDHVRWGGDTDPGAGTTIGISCGTLTATPLVITGTLEPAAPPDTTPNPYAFTDVTGVGTATIVTSGPVAITGIDAPAPISVSGDPTSQYSINSGPFTSVAGVISNGSTVRARHASSAAFGTTVDTVVNVGGVTDTFSSTTVAADTVPGQFTFTDRTNVELSTVITSASVTITGINTSAPISVSGDASSQYSIDNGAWTSFAGTITNGANVRVRHTSSFLPDTAVDTVLTVGGVTDTFTSRTKLYARDDAATTGIAQPVVIDVLANDTGFADPAYAGIWIDPAHGTAEVSGSPGPRSGIRITYTPAAGYVGPDSFEYWVESGSVVDYAIVSIDVLDEDLDDDGLADALDNCPVTANPGQEDSDGDGAGNACDNCSILSNADQRDSDADGYGNLCDPDLNGSGLVTVVDYNMLRSKLNTTDPHADLNGNGLVTALDVNILREYLNRAPGPSGLHP